MGSSLQSARPSMAPLVRCPPCVLASPGVGYNSTVTRQCHAARSARYDHRMTHRSHPSEWQARPHRGNFEPVAGHQGNMSSAVVWTTSEGARAVRTQHRRAAPASTGRAGAVRPRIGDFLLLVGSSAPSDHGAGAARGRRGVRAGCRLAGGGWGVHRGCGTRGRLFAREDRSLATCPSLSAQRRETVR